MNPYKSLSENFHKEFRSQADALCKMDAMAGDGDHGITISRGFTEAWNRVSKLPEDAKPAEIFKVMGYAMLGAMGGASGPIFSTFFIQSAITLREETELSTYSFKRIISASVDAISDLADVRPGEKTMMDALYGALLAVNEAGDCDLKTALDLAAEGAAAGAESTVDMVATKGRARFLGERSRGFMDAGSQSVVIIFRTMRDTLKKIS